MSIPTSADFTNHYRELDTMNRFSAFHGYFSIYESTIRVLVNIIDPLACNNGKANFNSVLNWLVARTRFNQRYNDFLELLRLTRNTVHHNGVYRPERGGDKVIPYKGGVYEFNIGQPIIFAGWEFMIMLQNDLIEFFLELVEEPVITNI